MEDNASTGVSKTRENGRRTPPHGTGPPEKPHHKPTPGRVVTTVSECARLKNKYKTTSSQNIQRENNTTTLDTHSAASIHPS
ncbi:hypothetical protein, partial [Bifidobacterium catenulatum]|uniref:hypothetical protein n=1 Tax=Bifidobacterium catenulatum TaxID=1686 RepID=UPI001C5B24EF